MKPIKYIAYLIGLVLATGCLVACESDDNHDNTPITINKVYLQRAQSTVVIKDREVDFVRLGQTLRIEGKGFEGLRKVYVNGYNTYFNNALATDNNLWITLDARTPIADAEDNVRNKIQFVKPGGTYEHEIIIRAASPTVTGMENTLPKAGELVTVYGNNLHETTKVTLPGGIEITDDIISDKEGKSYSFIMPGGVTESGSIYSEGANGIAATPAYFNFTECMVLDFDGAGSQGYWNWSETGSMINDEDLVDDPAESGRGKCVQLIPQRMLDAGGVLASKPRASECWTAGTGNEMDDWSRMYPYIPAETPLTEVAFQFDLYVPEGWTGTGHIEIVLVNNYNFAGIGSDDDGGGSLTTFLVPYIKDGVVEEFKNTGWQTITIPFSKFKAYATAIEKGVDIPTFQTVVENRNAATYSNFGMGMVNTDFTWEGVTIASTNLSAKIYADNWRVVPYESIEISDFEDEAEED